MMLGFIGESVKKQSNKIWVGEGEKAREVVNICRFEPNYYSQYSSGHQE
jgi:hypothetical protein